MSGALITEAVAARRFGMSNASLRSLRHRGVVTAAARNPWRYDPAALRAQLEERSSVGHGPGCPFGQIPRPTGHTGCECVICWCGEAFEPGGSLGACARCERPRLADLRAALAAPPARIR